MMRYLQREAGVSAALQVSMAEELRCNEVDELHMFSLWRHKLGTCLALLLHL